MVGVWDKRRLCLHYSDYAPVIRGNAYRNKMLKDHLIPFLLAHISRRNRGSLWDKKAPSSVRSHFRMVSLLKQESRL